MKSDGTSEKRQSVYSHNRAESTYTDSQGNISIDITTDDPKQSKTIREHTEKNVDGSVTENYVDAAGNTTVRKLLPDGTKSESMDLRDEAGRLVSRITRYEDGGEDRIDYVCDGNEKETGRTETRRNGVSAIIRLQYSDEEGYTGAFTQSFNNGLQLSCSVAYIDENTSQIVVNYSGGDVAQDTAIEKDYESLYVKTAYRDGRIEESLKDLSGDDKWNVREQTLLSLQERMDHYIEQCWNILP